MKISRQSRSAALVAVAAALLLRAPHVAAQAPGQPSTAERPAGNAETGKRLYTKYGCYECHGREGRVRRSPARDLARIRCRSRRLSDTFGSRRGRCRRTRTRSCRIRISPTSMRI